MCTDADDDDAVADDGDDGDDDGTLYGGGAHVRGVGADSDSDSDSADASGASLLHVESSRRCRFRVDLDPMLKYDANTGGDDGVGVGVGVGRDGGADADADVMGDVDDFVDGAADADADTPHVDWARTGFARPGRAFHSANDDASTMSMRTPTFSRLPPHGSAVHIGHTTAATDDGGREARATLGGIGGGVGAATDGAKKRRRTIQSMSACRRGRRIAGMALISCGCVTPCRWRSMYVGEKNQRAINGASVARGIR